MNLPLSPYSREMVTQNVLLPWAMSRIRTGTLKIGKILNKPLGIAEIASLAFISINYESIWAWFHVSLEIAVQLDSQDCLNMG